MKVSRHFFLLKNYSLNLFHRALLLGMHICINIMAKNYLVFVNKGVTQITKKLRTTTDFDSWKRAARQNVQIRFFFFLIF